MLLSLLCFAVLSGALHSCRKDQLNLSPNAALRTSVDSVKFDTVFSSTGSITQSFKILNPNDQRIRISDVSLMGGSASSFRINVNGLGGPSVTDIELEANDSIYVFVSVFINPNSSNLPFVVSDSVRIRLNGIERFVQLEAYGRNAVFLRNQTITGVEVWNNNLPYVILDGLRVDTGATLRIPAGCQVYMHANAPILIDGTLQVDGEKDNEVIFRGDRLDEYYRDLPGSWPGIYFRGRSSDNVLRFAIVKNAYQALVAIDPSNNSNPKLVLKQCIIDHASNAGLIGYRSSIDAENSLISNCGKNIIIQYGGDYQFNHCTAAAYSTNLIAHSEPVLTVLNFTNTNGNIQTNPLNAVFRNCIFWGSPGLVSNEVLSAREGPDPFNLTLEHCLYRAETDPAFSNLQSVIRNLDPLFDSIDPFNRYFDFHQRLQPLAPGIDQGTASGANSDLDNLPRPVGIPDIGCYERQ